MARTTTILIALMSIAGLAAGLVAAFRPGLGLDPGAAIMILLAVLLTIDLAAMRGLFGLVALSHGLRFGALISGFVLYLLATQAAQVLGPARHAPAI